MNSTTTFHCVRKHLKGNQNPHIKFTFIIKYSLLRTASESLNKIRQRIRKLQLFWNLAISRGRYSKWWQVWDNSPYVLYMKFHVFPLLWWLRQFPSLKSRYDKQGCILHGILWSRAMKTPISKENLKRMKFCVQNEWRVVHNCPHNWLPPSTVH